MTKNLDKVLTMTRDNIDMIAPAHGAVIKGNIVKDPLAFIGSLRLKRQLIEK